MNVGKDVHFPESESAYVFQQLNVNKSKEMKDKTKLLKLCTTVIISGGCT